MPTLLPLAPTLPLPVHGVDASRRLESQALVLTEPHALMQRAGLAVFAWARALYPHARQVSVVCGGGNNGGDGLVAALAWHRLLAHTGGTVTVVWLGDEDHLPADARAAWNAAQDAGVRFTRERPMLTDLWVDAMLGLGVKRPLEGLWAQWSEWLQASGEPVLCVDLPSGLDADQGRWWSPAPVTPRGPRHTLALLTLKPGLFTGLGREVCGELWFDDLGLSALPVATQPPTAWLHGTEHWPLSWRQRHSSHKGSRGQVVVLGGQSPSAGLPGMTGAALLAARAALHTGAGRVYVGLTGAQPESQPLTVDVLQPELMFRSPPDLLDTVRRAETVTVAGCGGGTSMLEWLPEVLQGSPALVLDADALNGIAHERTLMAALVQRRNRSALTVLTPHPLEAARLLGCGTEDVQNHRLDAAQRLAELTGACVVLKGSGTVVATADGIPTIIPTGNGLLATAGTGDVLAGMIGAYLTTRHDQPVEATATQTVCNAVFAHGLAADQWPEDSPLLTASDLRPPTPQ